MKGARRVRRVVNEFLITSKSKGSMLSEVASTCTLAALAKIVMINVLVSVVSGTACGLAIASATACEPGGALRSFISSRSILM